MLSRVRKRRQMKKVGLICVGLSLIAAVLYGYTLESEAAGEILYASSCAQEEIQALIDQAEDGDTIVVPEGVCTWQTSTANVPAVLVSGKSITLQGAGFDKTVIFDGTGDLCFQEPLRVMDTDGFRITGFTFRGMKRRSSAEPAIKIENSNKNWRIDHVKFDGSDQEPETEGRGLMVGGTGVIDHSVFINVRQGVAVFGDGDASWERPLSLGTGEAVYIEDCLFEYGEDRPNDGALDAYGGARYVFRYNTVINARVGHHGLDSGGYRAPHSFEIYHNTITMTITNSWYATRYRGGTGIVFDNTFIGNFNENITIGVVYYRSCCEVSHTNCSNWGRCDANPDLFCSATWQPCALDSDCPSGETCSRILDGHLDETGYPCRDQTGRTTDQDGDGIQDLAPLYEWGNTVNGNDADISLNDPWSCANPSMSDHLQEGRDFYNDTQMPGYTPYSYPHPLAVDSIDADLNEDGEVDILDLQLCVNVSLGKEIRPEVVNRADLNRDGEVNLEDVKMIGNVILGFS
jgi:pectate lyase